MAKNPVKQATVAEPTAEPVAEIVAEPRPLGIPSRPLFTTVVKDAPVSRPVRLSEKTLAEQAAGQAQLRAYQTVPASTEE